jgi:hypothetical protein
VLKTGTMIDTVTAASVSGISPLEPPIPCQWSRQCSGLVGRCQYTDR